MGVYRDVRSSAFMVQNWARLNIRRRHRRITKMVREHLELQSGMPIPSGEVWAVTVVKNEADILRRSLEHMLGQGVDVVLVADNGSTDGTAELIREMAHSAPLVCMTDSLAAHHHGVKITELGKIAGRAGARWVIPFDADEFWFAKGMSVADRLRDSVAGKDYATIHNIFPTSDRGDGEVSVDDEFRFDLSAHGQKKVAYRAHPFATVGYGNHHVVRAGPRESGLFIAHLPWRSFNQMKRKTREGWEATRLIGEGADNVGGHWQHLSGLDESELRQRWVHVLEGEFDETIGWSPVGPFVRASPLMWKMWCPEVASE